MVATITSPDSSVKIRIKGGSGNYKIYTSFQPMQKPGFVESLERKYNLVEIKNLQEGKGYFVIQCKKSQQETILEDIEELLYENRIFHN